MNQQSELSKYDGTIVEAISAVNNPYTLKENRDKAQEYLELFKQNSNCLLISMQLYEKHSLVDNDENNKVRFFALHCIQEMIKRQELYAQYNATIQAQIKEFLLKIMLSSNKTVLTEVNYIKEKIVVLVCTVMKYDWPEKWSDLFAIIFNNIQSSTNYLYIEYVLKIMQTIAEDCSDQAYNVTLPSKRRTVILRELHDKLEILFPFFYRILSEAYQNISSSSVYYNIIKSTLKTILAFLDWMPVKVLKQSNFMNVFLELLVLNDQQNDDKSINILACNCLKMVYSRKAAELDSTFDIIPMFQQFVSYCTRLTLPRIANLLSNDINNIIIAWPGECLLNLDELETLYELHSAMATALSQLISIHLESMFKELRPPMTQEKQTFLLNTFDLLLSVLGHPSILISNSVILAATYYMETLIGFNNEHRIFSQTIENRLIILLRNVADQTLKLGAPSSDCVIDSYTNRFSVIEFDDDVQFDVAHALKLNNIATFIRKITKLEPLLAVRFLRQRVQIACGIIKSENTNVIPVMLSQYQTLSTELYYNLENNKYCSMKSPVQMYHSATMMYFIENVVQEIPDQVFVTYSQLGGNLPNSDELLIAKEIDVIMSTITSYTTNDTLLLMRQFQAYSRLYKVYEASPYGSERHLPTVLDQLFKNVTFRTIEEANENTNSCNLEPNTLGTRRRACCSLLEICKKLTTSTKQEAGVNSQYVEMKDRTKLLMVNQLPKFCEMVLSIIRDTKGGGVLHSEKIILFETLVVISNALNDLNKQSLFLNDILSDSLNIITSQLVVNACDNISNFIQFIGCGVKNLNQSVQTKVAYLDSNFHNFPSQNSVEMKYSLNTLFLVVGRSYGSIDPSSGIMLYPFTLSHWSNVLPVIFKLVSIIHQLWTFEGREFLYNNEIKYQNSNDYSCQFLSLIQISPEELKLLFKHIDSTSDSDSVRPSAATASSSTNKFTFNQFASCCKEPTDDMIKKQLHNSSYLMMNIRDTCYRVLGLACKHHMNGLYGLSNISNLLGSNIFQNLHVIEHRHIRTMMSSFLLTFIEKCPVNARSSVLISTLLPFFNHMLNRMTVSIKLLKNLNNQSSFNELFNNEEMNLIKVWYPILPFSWCHSSTDSNAAISEIANYTTQELQQSYEIIIDVVTRQMFKSYIDIIACCILQPLGKSSRKKDVAKVLQEYITGGEQATLVEDQPLWVAFLTNDAMAQSLLLSTVLCFQSNDYPTSSRAITIIERLIPILILAPNLSSFLSSHLFPACLQNILYEVDLRVDVLMVFKDLYFICILGIACKDLSSPSFQSLAERKVDANLRQLALNAFQNYSFISNQVVVNLENEVLAAGNDKRRKGLVKDFITDLRCITLQGAELPKRPPKAEWRTAMPVSSEIDPYDEL